MIQRGKKTGDLAVDYLKADQRAYCVISGHFCGGSGLELKLAQWASLKPIGKIINTVMVRSSRLTRIGETSKNGGILEQIIATQNQNVHEKGYGGKNNF